MMNLPAIRKIYIRQIHLLKKQDRESLNRKKNISMAAYYNQHTGYRIYLWTGSSYSSSCDGRTMDTISCRCVVRPMDVERTYRKTMGKKDNASSVRFKPWLIYDLYHNYSHWGFCVTNKVFLTTMTSFDYDFTNADYDSYKYYPAGRAITYIGGATSH